MSPPRSSESTARPIVETRELVLAALFAAMLAASAWVAFPVGTVPVTLQVFVVSLAALLLRPMASAMAIGAYLTVGTVGVPVFAGMQGGPGVLFGPTGGYLAGFFVGAIAGSWVFAVLSRARSRALPAFAAVAGALVCVYLLGWLQLKVVTGMGWGQALAAGVIPFIGIDAVKALVAIGVAGSLRRAGVVD